MNVGYLLYREVRDFAPGEWTHAELVVALMIADDANEDTRKSWIPNPLLCQRARLTDRGLRGALCHMAATGYEFRIARSYDKNGSPVFAAKGHAVDYLVPDMLKGGTVVPPLPVDNSPKGGTVVPAMGTQRRHETVPKAARERSKGGTTVPPLSSDLLSISSAEALDLGDAPVEGARARPGQDRSRWMDPRLLAAAQAAESRAIRQRKESR